MNNKRATKRALLTSVMALVMCVVMLVGTTFAWFTDTASTGVNKIQAGNLDITVEYAKEKMNDDGTLAGELTGWAPIDNATEVFDPNALWEPGRTEYVVFRITNNGNLALKYKLSLETLAQKPGTNKANKQFYLADYLCASAKVDVGPGEIGSGVSTLGAFMTKLNDLGVAGVQNVLDPEYHPLTDATVNGTLLPGKTNCVPMAIWMPTSVGNEANAIDDSEQHAATIDFGITVVATQYTHEKDSFDDQYDKEATYPVTNDTELKDAISSGKPGTSVAVAPGTYALPATVAAGVSIVGSGANNTTLQAPATTSSLGTTGLVISNEGVKISDVTLTAPKGITSNEYCGVVDINNGGTALENVVINNNAGYASSVVVNAGVKKGETVTLSNVTLNGGFKPIHIVDSANGTVVLDNCEITGTYTLNVNSNSSQDLVLKVNNSKLHGWTSYSKIHSATFVNTEFSKGGSAYDYMRPYADTTLTNCTFDADFLMGAGATGITITIDQCTFGGTSVTAENIKAMLDEDDMANLKNCTIIVNGVNVKL